MSQELLDLTKKVDVVLDLRKIPETVKAQVCLALDGSGSMTSLYNNGTVQKTVNRISAVAVKFDDNSELDVMVFSNNVNEAKSATPEMFGAYVQTELLKKNLVQFGGTEFAPMINQVVENYFSPTIMNSIVESSGSILRALKGIFSSSKPEPAKTVNTSSKSTSGYPIFCIIITDGDNSDKTETTKLLEHMQDKDIYWQFVGIGNDTRFDYVRNLGDVLPNVGFFHIPNLEEMKDMELYKNLLNEEFSEWIKKF